MTTLTNSFEGGTNGTGITAANSGGASGNAFDNVLGQFGGTVTYSSTVAAHGSLSAKVRGRGRVQFRHLGGVVQRRRHRVPVCGTGCTPT